MVFEYVRQLTCEFTNPAFHLSTKRRLFGKGNDPDTGMWSRNQTRPSKYGCEESDICQQDVQWRAVK